MQTTHSGSRNHLGLVSDIGHPTERPSRPSSGDRPHHRTDRAPRRTPDRPTPAHHRRRPDSASVDVEGPDCTHAPRAASGVRVIACESCGVVEFSDREGAVTPTVALGRLFGSYDLVGSLPTLHAPAGLSLLYRAATRQARRSLAVFPINQWFRVDDELWLSHDGHNLLLATHHAVVDDLSGDVG